MAKARRRTVTSGEVALAVVEFGDPAHPPVVLVHGYPDSKEVWSLVAERLADRFHVVLYDVRGHGESTAPRRLRGGFRLESLTDDFLAVVDAVSPDRPVHLVGHDWGSVQGWEFATVPGTRGRIASFTSVSGPSLDHLGHWVKRRLRHPTPHRVGELLRQLLKSWYVYALHTPVLPELAWRGVLGRSWPRMLARTEGLGSTPGNDRSDLDASAADVPYPAVSLPNDAANGAWLYRDNVRRRVRRPRTDAHAHVPVQLITPTEDAYLSPHLYDDLDQWAPELTRHSLPAKHWLPRSRPDQLARWTAEFALAHDSGERSDVGTVHEATSGDADTERERIDRPR
jgi:pimeloyl-ACP methyl ester carboxylesterase